MGFATSVQIEIGQERKKMFIEQLTIDAAFLRDHGIMDYSLLLGISYASCSQGLSQAFVWLLQPQQHPHCTWPPIALIQFQKVTIHTRALEVLLLASRYPVAAFSL